MNIGIENVDFLTAVAVIVSTQLHPGEELFPEGFQCTITCTHGAVDMENLNRKLNQRDKKISAAGFAAGYEAAKADLVAALRNVHRPGIIRISGDLP